MILRLQSIREILKKIVAYHLRFDELKRQLATIFNDSIFLNDIECMVFILLANSKIIQEVIIL